MQIILLFLFFYCFPPAARMEAVKLFSGAALAEDGRYSPKQTNKQTNKQNRNINKKI
jgi:hypothetical protein